MHPDLKWYPSGQSAIKGRLLTLFFEIDQRFREIAQGWDAEEHRVPAFIPAAELQRIDYLGSFPHTATFPVSISDNQTDLQGFVDGGPLYQDGTVALSKLAPVRDLLTPAACYHFYYRFQDQALPQPLFLTTLGSCFRREKEYVPLRRQWNFSMREIVCLGTAEEVETFLATCRNTVETWIEALGLKVDFLNATDPFFNPSRNPKFLMQRLAPNKTEVVYGGELAIASFNFHRNYFGDAFSIERSGQAAYSGCVAFGVERWLAAFIDQFGPDISRWPELPSPAELASRVANP